jgi:RNA polymerase sigma-70 factor (TIGR02960 family)
VTERTLSRARAGDEDAFRELIDPYRGELQLHCYRILGSVQEAEDLLQETLLAAWRGLERFDGRSSLRAWLYRIATNRCLNALRDKGRRPREVQSIAEPPKPTRRSEPIWLEPYPDALLDTVADTSPEPEACYELKEAVGLAFVTGLQHLPPRQRAVLVLRDVLGFRATEVAEMLQSSEAAVKGALQRARAALETRLPAGDRERSRLPPSARERELVARFADAVESGDVDGGVTLLTDEAWLTITPSNALLIESPTAQTSVAETAATPRRLLFRFALGLGTVVHLEPSQWVTSVCAPLDPPASPTTHTFEGARALMPYSTPPMPVGPGTSCQALPFQCSIRA